jgi:hypothetical protein
MACFPQKARKDSMSELAKQSLENLNIISGVVCYETTKLLLKLFSHLAQDQDKASSNVSSS